MTADTTSETVLPWTSVTVEQARSTLTSWRAPRRGRGNYEADMQSIGLGLLTLLTGAAVAEPPEGRGLVVPGVDLPLDRIRARVSGWHFAKESLTDNERRLLYIVEGLLRLLDDLVPDGYAR